MDHITYVDKKAKELEKLLNGDKTIIIRGATGRKMPYGRVEAGDILYLVENDGSGLAKAKAEVTNVLNSKKLSKGESTKLVVSKQVQLRFTNSQFKRWAGKRYLVLIEIKNAEEIPPFRIDRSAYGNMDDWLPMDSIESVKME